MTKTESYRRAETWKKVCLLFISINRRLSFSSAFLYGVGHKYGVHEVLRTGLTEQTPLLSRQRGNARVARRDPIVRSTYRVWHAWCFSLAMQRIIAALCTRYSDSPEGRCAPVSGWRMVEQSNDDRRAAHDDDQMIRAINPPSGFPGRGNLCWSYFTG